MSYEKLLSNLGFVQDPFASWDADEEDRLEDYFIRPPFFNAVFSEPHKASVAIVFAPRGGGKSALRRMIEIESPANEILCITYAKFPTDRKKLSDIDLEYHLENIVILILVGLVGYLVSEDRRKHLSADSRKTLYWLLRKHLSGLQQAELRKAISEIRSMSQTSREWWNSTIKVANPLVQTVAAALAIPALELTQFDNDKIDLGPLSEQLRFLSDIAIESGAKSTYILIDRIDENDLTGNDSVKAFEFISSLLKNLNVLQTPGIGFKVFLWNLLKTRFREECREDRMKTFNLDWKNDQIKEMMASRISAYSNGKHNTLDSLVKCERSDGLDDLVAFLAQGSPRNAIRICQEILAQQSEMDASVEQVSEAAFIAGVDVFAKKHAEATVSDPTLRELQKIGRLDFTVLFMYREVFKISQQAGLQKIRTWGARGIVKQIGVLRSESGSFSNHYAITDPILCKFICASINIFDFLNSKVRKCPSCTSYNVRDWNFTGSQACLTCQRDIDGTSEGHW